MADKLMAVQVSIPMDTGLLEDAVTNTWHFDGDDTLGEDTDAEYHSTVYNLLQTFYQAIDGLIFPARIASPAVMRIYDLRDAKPRVPEFEGTIPLTPINDESYPSEVALCLSYQADPVSGMNQRLRRGRIYLGPYCFAARDLGSSDARPSPTAVSGIAAAAGVLRDGADTVGGSHVSWAVYSPTWNLGRGPTPKGSPAITAHTLDDAFNDVTNGWVDNAFDTQRRRGIAASSRTLFS